eukprot:CAMPEP_0119553150 /NCGR_PEP_ID=MMETSP1352-20130426/5971_1 /TAXON_ID=265584 /ORGANISM="Stauroneis constricta, Strain CCMP1120" /LENGTH=116 /DNA_ID=CAMNT_0007599505 /DNA_START=352 /DNA_END=702 /DNA_ORIENTATION=+
MILSHHFSLEVVFLLEIFQGGRDDLHGVLALGGVLGEQVLLPARPNRERRSVNVGSDRHLDRVHVDAILDDVGVPPKHGLHAGSSRVELLSPSVSVAAVGDGELRRGHGDRLLREQ